MMLHAIGKRKTVCWMLLLLGPATGCQETAAPHPTVPASNPPPVAMQLTGTSSCSGRACHGNASPAAGQAVQLNEFSTWALHDPHVGAYEVLLNERSKKIARNLRIPGEKAESDVRCLACHTNPLAALPTPSAALQAEHRLGVGCESCHGPASGWLVSHTTAEWKKLTVAEKAKQGMYPVQDLVARAEMCAGCHVGQPADTAKGIPARDLYHDLLGAGHPRLSFELGSYLSNLPPHWLEKVPEPGHEAKVWAVGQVVSAKSALQLLAERAGNLSRPWPEFAEYDCAACHHDLREPAQWEPGGAKGRPPLGALPWNDWYVAMLPSVLDNPPSAELADLRALLAKRYPDREKTAQQARAAGRKLSDQLNGLQARKFDRATVQQLLAKLGRSGIPESHGSWDTTDQLCLALFALTEADARVKLQDVKLTPVEQRQKIDAALQGLLDQLTRPANGKRSLRRDPEFRKDLDSLLRRLGE
jgi:hypothetical protein